MHEIPLKMKVVPRENTGYGSAHLQVSGGQREKTSIKD